MKQSSKNENEILDLVNKIQAQLIALDKKVDSLISRSLPPVKPVQTQAPANNKGRTMHKAICADCKKECTIPFKPSGDRPVYCQDCFSRRKVISLSGIKVTSTQAPIQKVEETPPTKAKAKKRLAASKKSVTKKKPVAKKKQK